MLALLMASSSIALACESCTVSPLTLTETYAFADADLAYLEPLLLNDAGVVRTLGANDLVIVVPHGGHELGILLTRGAGGTIAGAAAAMLDGDIGAFGTSVVNGRNGAFELRILGHEDGTSLVLSGTASAGEVRLDTLTAPGESLRPMRTVVSYVQCWVFAGP